LEKLENSHPVEVMWRAFELRPRGAPPVPPEYRAKIAAGRPRLYAIAREQYGLELKQGPFGIDSRTALIGAKFAEANGRGPEYHRAIFAAYWLRAEDIGEVETLAQAAEASGLDRTAFLAGLADPQFDAQVQEDEELARAYGLNGVPAIVFEEKYLVSGAQPYPVLVQVTERVMAERNGDATTAPAT
jgi:predicted DsbA family dithiol-disulfide isomerase